ncbi:hypothetical protein HG535_0E01990 [Zygotorulaspora mrakii]|uniref:Autophagy-related protein 23 n=1 Tax=Zygotorulaspora mrakii TaxID=42260 RepID=A0A7H9B369_ZYGMR|nr:uncharacterized protein HG535_0E01990 [Zygotorulaspora mrakii]QLG73115.1 hypothetical protein HG535_0E01990 [Zygotorulaspora mrakii]
MGLQDVLRQNAEITDFLKQLVEIHAHALKEQALSSELYKIRGDILICFNDLCRLNEMLIACDGEIKEEIDVLKRAKAKFRKLGQKEQLLASERGKWAEVKENADKVTLDTTASSTSSVSVSSNYRPFLDQYIELVGAQQTTLAQEDTDSLAEETEDDPKKLIESVQLLEKCHSDNLKDIQKLEQLMKTFMRDRQFVEKELKLQNGKIRRNTRHWDEELKKVRQSREKVLVRVGLLSSDLQESSLTKRFFNFNFTKGKDEKLQTEVSDITSHFMEFTDMKIFSLQDQLTHKKEDSSRLTNRRNIWNDCMQCVKNLEDQLSFALSNSDDLVDSSSKVITWLREAIDYLNNLVRATDFELLTKLVNNEKEVIEKAYNEFPKSELKKTLMPNTISHSSSPPRHHPTPPFSVASKSPPKIGISELTVNLTSNENAYELSNKTLMKNKSKKKD